MHALDWLFDEGGPWDQPDLRIIIPDVKVMNLQNWARHGIVVPVNGKPAKGTRRLYDAASLCFIALANELVRLRVPGNHAMDIATGMMKGWNDVLGARRGEITWAQLAAIFALVRSADDGPAVVQMFDLDAPPFAEMFLGDHASLVVPVGKVLTVMATRARELAGRPPTGRGWNGRVADDDSVEYGEAVELDDAGAVVGGA